MKKSYTLPVFLFSLFIFNFGFGQSQNLQTATNENNENSRSVIGDVWAFDMSAQNYGKFPLVGPYNLNVIATIPYIITASDFDDSMTIYGVDFLTNELIQIEPTTGAHSVVATLSPVPSGHTVDGMSWNYVNSSMYVVSGNGSETSLHTLDLATGALSIIGTTTDATSVWIVIDNNGIAYIADTITDELYIMDLTNGQVTLVGSLGINIEFSQEADIDVETNILYMGGYLGNDVQNIYSVNTTTGAASFISGISNASELGIFAIEGTPGPIDNFVCEDALPIVLGTGNSNNPGNTSGGASNVCFAGATNAEWYSFTATLSGDLTVSSDLPENAGIDTRLSIYNSNCSNLSCIAQDDNSGTGNTSTVTFAVTQGTTYLMEWDDSNNTTPFTYNLTFVIDCPAPQNFSTNSITDISANLSWSAVTNASSGYEISVFNEGDDPLSDPPVYTNNVASGDTTDTVTGLNPDTPYDAYVIADCAGGILSNASMITFTTNVISCPFPQNLMTSNITETTADLSWSGVTNATEGYLISVYLEGDDPSVDPSVYSNNIASGETADTVDGLSPNTAYDAYVISNCAGGIISNAATVTFSTLLLSSEDNAPVMVSIFPNPTEGIVTIISENNIQNIGISDINGRWLQYQTTSCQECNLDLSNFTSGVYFMVVNSEDNTTVYKILKR